MSDVLIVALGLLAAVTSCLAKPCGPAQWAVVKPARAPLDELPARPRELAIEPAPVSQPGFADGLTVTV